MNYFKGQTKRFDTNKNERGITLVALIITIIILIILAAVTINALTHDGLADMAIKGAQDYDKAQQNEMNMLNDIDTMVRDTIKNIEDGTRPDEPTPPPTPDFSDTIDIANNNTGKTVDYSPIANQSYTVESKYSGHSSSQSFNTSNITGGWSLWGVDDTNIYVIADNTTSNKLTLSNHLGYNNGVTLLDTICDTCFTDKTTYPNMKGQNLKLEQVLAVTNPSNATNANTNYGKRPYSYSFKYPYIWNQYEKSEATGSKDWESNKSKAYPLTTQTALTSNITYSPYSNYWYYGSKNWNSTSYWKNAGYHRMVMTPAQSATYWLSSRCVLPNDSSYCYFGLQFVNSSGVYYNYLYRYYSGSPGSSDRSFAVRPLVSFPMADYALQNDADSIKIVKRS